MTPGPDQLASRRAFEDYSRRLLESVGGFAEVEGLVLLGSTADTSRVDQWSDHDFYLIVRPGQEERFRTDLRWLPDHDRIAFAVRETAHGLKVVYDSGAVLEFAVANAVDAVTFGGSPQRVVLDRGGLAHQLQEHQKEPNPTDDLTHFRLFLALILIGVGRARRGEELAGGQLVRTYAAERLMWLLARYPPAADHPEESDAGDTADPFNPWRRFERRHPSLGRALGAALAQRCEPCGLRLLVIAEQYVRPGWAGYPDEEAATVRRALGVTAGPTKSVRRPG